MTGKSIECIFIGGYTKSGTTFVGRIFDNLQGVYARGEMDFFRIFATRLLDASKEYVENIQRVNKEVYDGFGSLEPLTDRRVQQIHRQLFLSLFFNGGPAPGDCSVIVEKSPRNIFHMQELQFLFPKAAKLCVYRDPVSVYRSLMRHMSDHRSKDFLDPNSALRRKFFGIYHQRQWPDYIRRVNKWRKELHLVRYDNIAADTGAFVDYIQREILKREVQLKAPLESLTKEAYLASLPAEAKAKSLVQKGRKPIPVSEEELALIARDCKDPDGTVDF